MGGDSRSWQRRAQVVGDIRDGIFELRVAVLQLQTLLAQRTQLAVYLRGECAHGFVAGGNGDERVRVRTQLVVKLPRDFSQRRA